MSTQREKIEIAKIDENIFRVTVRELGTSSEHMVELDDEYYHKLAGSNITKMELVRLSFRFLLKREVKELILDKFNLNMISRYFPEYEDEVSV